MMITSQEKYQNKMTRAGMYKMSVWIPKQDTDRLSTYAQKLRVTHLNKQKREARDEAS